MREQIQQALPAILSFRHYLHQHPELSFKEYHTAEAIAAKLAETGYEVQTNIGQTGVVAVLDSGKPGKTVGLRADMDALPLTEETNLEYKSVNSGVMHACGHDGHVATLLLAANVLRHYTNSFAGQIKFIFQPAEELGLGAKAMIQTGLLTTPPMDAIFGYHNLPGYPKGQVLVRSGCIMAGRMVLRIKIMGKGGHSSAPEKTIDPIYVGGVVVQTLHSIRNLNFSPFEKLVISITQFKAGSADNIIPKEAFLAGTIRFTENNSITAIQQKIKRAVNGIAASLGATAEIEFPDVAPATVNSPQETEWVYETAKGLFGQQNVSIMQDNIMASEDFSFFLEKIPGCFFLVGTGEDLPYLHSPTYSFEDGIIPIAAELLSNVALNYLASE